jgi:hypothetical protein
LKDLSKLIKLKRVLFSKLKTKKNLKKVVLLKSKKDKIVNKINKFFSLLLKFLILFENKATLCCSYNIIAKSRLTLIEFKNLLITLIVFDCLKEDKN